jgi:hypothetical protein
MKLLRYFLIALLNIAAFGQTIPNLSLKVPTPGTATKKSESLINNNFTVIDNDLSGVSPLSSISVKNLTGCLVDSVAYIGGTCASFWGGGSLSSQANAAYAGFGANGGSIYVIQGTYSDSGSIVFGTQSKPAFLTCSSGTIINATSSSGTYITLDWGIAIPGGQGDNGGVQGCIINGNKGTSVGISLSTANGFGHGVNGAVIRNNTISGFNNGIVYGNYDNTFRNDISNNNIQLSVTAAISVAGDSENFSILNNCLCGGAIGLNILSTAYAPSLLLSHNSIDSNTSYGVQIASGAAAYIKGIDNHFEDNTGNAVFFNLAGGYYSGDGDSFTVDHSSGSAPGIATVGATCEWDERNANLGFAVGSTFAYTTLVNTTAANASSRLVDIVAPAFKVGLFTSNPPTGQVTLLQSHEGAYAGDSNFYEFFSNRVLVYSIDSNGALHAPNIYLAGPTPTGSGAVLSLGSTNGFGIGSSGTSVTTTTKGRGTGPTTAQTIVKYLEVDIGGTKYWIPLMQ